jgi:hypothetical protein
LALELNIVRSIVAKADLSISSWCYDSVERREWAKVMSVDCGLMEKLEAHLCDFVEGKWFIHLLIKRSATYFPLSDEVNSS